MRTKILIALSFSLLALYAFSTHAIDNRYVFSADQLIDASRGIYPSGPTPQEARANLDKTSGVDNANPPPSPESSNIATNQTVLSQVVATPSATSAAGNWSFTLKDIENRSMNISLSQSGDILLGVGMMNEDNRTQMISASGFLVGDKLNLNIISLVTANLFTLSLTKKDDTASGEYKAFTSGGESWIGNAEGLLAPNNK